jgi:hypothetical protein
LIDIRAGEGRLVAPIAALGFVVIAAQVLTTIASDTIFVTKFSLGDLSGFIAVTAVTRVLLTFAYGAVARHRGPRVAGALLVTVGAVTATLGDVVRTRSHTTVYAACVTLLIVPVAAAEAVNGMSERFPARQGKRLVPLVAACSTFGGIVAGALAHEVAPRSGTRSLLWLAGALLAVGGVFVGTSRDLEPVRAPASADSGPGVREVVASVARDWRLIPIVRVAVAVALLAAVASGFVDFLFKATLKASFSRDQMAAYVGTVEAILSAGVMFAQLFLTARVVGRFGIRGALQLHPTALAVVAAAFALAPGVPSATAAKLSESFFRFTITTPLRPLMLAPLEPRTRARASLLVRGIAVPLGGVLAAGVLGAFGRNGPPAWALGALLVAIAVLVAAASRGAGRAHAGALASAVGEGRLSFDVPPAASAALANGLREILRTAVAEQDARRAGLVLALLGEKRLSLDDLATAARSDNRELVGIAARAAIRAAKPGDGARLLAVFPASDDDAIERDLLAAARRLGGFDQERIERALARCNGTSTSAAASDLWAESLLSLARHGDAEAADRLLSAAATGDPVRRAPALRAVGELGDDRAIGPIRAALDSADVHVFSAAANAVTAIRGQEHVEILMSHVVHGPHFGAAARALTLVGEDRASQPLLDALETQRVSVLGGTRIQIEMGPVRAARVLTRLGPKACAAALARYPSLGHRAREAVAESLASLPEHWRTSVPAASVDTAIVATLADAEALARMAPSARSAHGGLFARERRLRIARAARHVLDLASICGQRARIEKARAALARTDRARADALELLEHVLPRAFAKRTVALLEVEASRRRDSEPPSVDAEPPIERWLETCRLFDRGELTSPPMVGLLDKLLVLGESSLFDGMTSEELHPIGEIAVVEELVPGDMAVRQGDPGDAVFVVADGTLEVKRDGRRLKELRRGAVFGEVALLDGGPRAASVEATTHARLLRIPRAEFEALIDQYPEIARGIIRTLLAHLRGSA